MSPSFQHANFANLVFPSQMYIDYVRVYQREGVENGFTCDPPARPTKDYIQKYGTSYYI